MSEKGNGLIESLLFLSAVLLAVGYLLTAVQAIGKIENYEINNDSVYKEANS